jgi:stage III sporulation protein AG
MPEIRGVAIVCIGGDNELIAQKIENTVTAALNITSQRVSIAGGN